MTGLRRILKDYQESGALHALLGVQDAVGDGVFSTKSGDLLMVLTLSGPDYECLDASETDRISRRFESVLRVLDEKFRVYQYWIKREEPAVPANHYRNALVEETLTDRLTYLKGKAATLYSLETYLVIVYEGWGPAHAWRSHIAPLAERARTVLHPSLSTEKMRRSLTQSLDLAIEFLVTKVRSFAIQLSDPVTVEVLDSQRAFGFFRRLVNYAPFKAESVQLKHNNFVDYQLCGSALECHRDYLRQDDYFVKVLTLKEPPVRTFAQMLRNFAEIPGNALVVSEWRRESVIKMRRLIRSKRRHYHNSKASLLNYLNSSPQSGTPDMLVDDSAVAMVASLGACLSEMEVHGHSFGEFALTVVLYDRVEAALRHSVAQCFKVFANQDAQLTEEGANCLNAWLATLPGNADYNLRKIWLLDANYADLSFLCTLSQGRVRDDHLGAEYLAVLEGSAGVPYFFNFAPQRRRSHARARRDGKR